MFQICVCLMLFLCTTAQKLMFISPIFRRPLCCAQTLPDRYRSYLRKSWTVITERQLRQTLFLPKKHESLCLFVYALTTLTRFYWFYPCIQLLISYFTYRIYNQNKMYSGQFYGNQAYNSNFNDKMTMRPNYSIDKVIERVHIIASDINELTHIVSACYISM